jgi:hypothetical protein
MLKLMIVAAIVASAGAQPVITNITNAAIPSLDTPPDQIYLNARSIATIWGSDLADSTVAIAPPWKESLGGTEVHIVVSDVYGSSGAVCSGTCEFVTQLLYVSPTQINFLTPYLQPGYEYTSRIVFIRDGVRYDNHYDLDLPGPGLVTISTGCDADCNTVFQVGYDCLFSFSKDTSTHCGLSWDQGLNRAALGAITDLSGNLISSSNPIHQAQIVTLWVTGLANLTESSAGNYVETDPSEIGFGISQHGMDLAATVEYSWKGGYTGAFFSPAPLFAGESPQYPGLDQINVRFPQCASSIKATSESRYDAWLAFGSSVTGTVVRIYLPFEVLPGEQDCDWVSSTTLTSSADPATLGQNITFTATVSPSTVTGLVTFVDGSNTLGTVPIDNHLRAQFATSQLPAGVHSITASYGGDPHHDPSTSQPLTETVQ